MLELRSEFIDNHANKGQSARVVAHITHEVNLHIEYCRGFGISQEEMMNSEENEGMWTILEYSLDIANRLLEACTAYTRQEKVVELCCLLLIFCKICA